MKLLVALAALVALAPIASDKLVFGPSEGTKLEKTFHFDMHLEKQSMSMSIGGQELPKELTEQATMEFGSTKEITVVDEYKKVDGGRTLLLARHYAKLSDHDTSSVQMVGMPEPQEEDKSKSSKLEDKRVLFRWDADKGEYAKEWDGDAGDADLLEGVEQDMDMLHLLPAKAVAEGDTWELDMKEFNDLLGPGGKLGFKDAKDEDDDEFEENMKGTAECTFKGVTEVDGRKLARIAAVCKATTFSDKDGDDGPKMHLTFAFEVEGDFLWDVQAKHLASYELSGDITGTLAMKQEIEAQGQKHELHIDVELAGKMEVKGEFTKG